MTTLLSSSVTKGSATRSKVEQLFPFDVPRCKSLRVGLIGLGWIAEAAHLPALRFLQGKGWPVHISALCDIKPARRALFEQYVPEATFFDDAKALLTSGTVDAVFILTFPPFTTTLLQIALENELAVFAEKPVSHALSDFESLAKLSAVAGRPVQIGYNRRFQILSEQFRKEIAQTQNIFHVRANLWRASRKNPIFYEDTTVHLLDFLQYNFGRLTFQNIHRFPKLDLQSNLPAAIHAQFTDKSGILFELNTGPRVGRNLESYEVLALGRSLSLSYPATAELTHPVALDVYEEGKLNSLAFQLNSDEVEAMAYARGFIHQAASFCRIASNQREPLRCSLEDAYWAQYAFDALHSHIETK